MGFFMAWLLRGLKMLGDTIKNHESTSGYPTRLLSEMCQDTRGSSHCDSVVTNPTSIHEYVGSFPGLAQWVKDLALLWVYDPGLL